MNNGNNGFTPWNLVGLVVVIFFVIVAIWFFTSPAGKRWWAETSSGGEAGLRVRQTAAVEVGTLLLQDLDDLKSREEIYLSRFWDSGIQEKAAKIFDTAPYCYSRHRDVFHECQKMGKAQHQRLLSHQQHVQDAIRRVKADPHSVIEVSALLDEVRSYVDTQKWEIARLHHQLTTVVEPIAEGRNPTAAPPKGESK